MRPRPQHPTGQYPDAEARNNAIRCYREDDYRWLKSLAASPHVQAVMHIPADEPIFALRAKDKFSAETVDFWLARAEREVSAEKFGRAAMDYSAIVEWQKKNPDQVKIPD